MRKMAEAGPMHKGTSFELHPREQGRKVKGIKAYGFGLAARAFRNLLRATVDHGLCGSARRDALNPGYMPLLPVAGGDENERNDGAGGGDEPVGDEA